MLEQRIQQQFFESADLKYQSAEVLGRPIEDAATALVGGLTAGGRVLAAGLGASASLAHMVVTALIGCFERDRPGLAALAIVADGSVLSVAPSASSFDAVLARQIETLGQPGDVLLLMDAEGDHPALLAAVRAAASAGVVVGVRTEAAALNSRTACEISGASPDASSGASEGDTVVGVPTAAVMTTDDEEISDAPWA